MADFVMPSLGADMEKGTIVRWLVKPGDKVRRGDIVVEIETEKSDMDVEIFQDGTVREILVPEGETVLVGTPLARIEAGVPGEPLPAPRAAAPTPPAAPRLPVRPPPERPPVPPPAVGRAPAPAAVRATPVARELAAQLGIDLSRLKGSGVDGRITREDVERAAASAAAQAPAVAPAGTAGRASPYARRLAAERGLELAELRGTGPGGAILARDITARAMPAVEAPGAAPAAPAGREEERRVARQRMIGSLMARSKREIPHYYLEEAIDVTATQRWLEAENAKRPLAERVLFAAVLLRSVALAAAAFPALNGHYEEGGFRPSEAVHLGVAIALRDGSLVTPAILDAAAKSLPDLMASLRDLVERARSGRLRASEMASATITVTNLGDTGVDAVYGVIYPPQVAIVGFGRIDERPWAEQGMLAVRRVVTATLAADHRVSNGHAGARFLNAVARNLTNPEKL